MHSALGVLQNKHALCRFSRKIIIFHLGFKKIYELYLFYCEKAIHNLRPLYELSNFRLKQLWIYKIEIQVLLWKCARSSELWWGLWTNFRSFSTPLYMDSSLWKRNLDSGFKSLVGFRFPWSVFEIPQTHDSGFHKQNFLRFRIRQTKISLIPQSGFLPRGHIFTSSSCGIERKVWRHVAMVVKYLDDNNRELTMTAKATRTGKKN